MAAEVMVRTYGGNNQAEAVLLYAEDAPKLAADGWVRTMVVTYQRPAPAAEPSRP